MSRKKIIVVGSTSVLKKTAVLKVFGDAHLFDYDVDSGVGDQPVGKDLTEKGALTRAQAALKGYERQYLNQNVDLVFGIENGIFKENDGKWYDVAAIAILQKEGEEFKPCILWSDLLEVPQRFITKCFDKNGQVLSTWHPLKDPHLELSGRSRVDFLYQAIAKWNTKNTPELGLAAIQEFHDKINEGSPIAIGVISALTKAISLSKSMTLLHLNRDLDIAREALCRQNNSIAVQSLCDLFKKYVTRTWDDLQNFALLKEKLIKRGEQFKVNTEESTAKIAKNGSSFIRDGMTVLTHGYSTVVLNLLTTAKDQGKRFSVYVTETRPADQSYKTVDALLEKKIPTTIIADTTVAHIMSDIDLVLVGAAHVVENGGVLNEVGTYQLSIVAKTFRKPFYVAAQSFKFTRKLYPLNQKEIPDNEALLQENQFITDLKKKYPSLQVFRPSLDYTPPSYLTLLFTDLGVLTPSAVSDELIKLYT